MDDLYHQQILEHYNAPHHAGKLENPDIVIEETNASCGDSFTYYVQLDNSRLTIHNLSFTGTGCAISTASSSLLLDYLIGKSLSELTKLDSTFMQQLIGAQVTPARIKCLMLPVQALTKTLNTF